jgi:tetratricopeptide (TPR) repeat protein
LLNSIGDLQLDLNERELAEKTYRTAVALAKTLDSEFYAFFAYQGLSKLELLQGKYDKAMQLLREAARVSKRKLESAWYQSKLGEILLEMGQFDLAIEALQSALAQWADDQRFPGQEQLQTVFWLGRAYFAKGQTDYALRHFDNCLKGAARLGYDQFLVIAGRRASAFLRFAARSWPDNSQLHALILRVNCFWCWAGPTQWKIDPKI